MWMLTGANGYALDERNTRFNAVLIDGERIVAVGNEAELRMQAHDQLSRIVNVEGATVIPGLVDNHLHVAGVGEQAMKLNLDGTTSAREMLARIETFAKMLPQSAWVLGGGWNDNLFLDHAVPTLSELDSAAGGRPLFLTRVCRHAYLANSAAFHAAGVQAGTPNPGDGAYGYHASGELNGWVYENASKPFFAAIPPWSMMQWKQALENGMTQCVAAGLTAVHTDDVRYLGNFRDTWLTYHALQAEGMSLRVHELVDWDHIDACLAAMADLPPESDWLQRGAAKLFSDGAFGGRTAWLATPYADASGETGMPIYSPEELARRVRVAHEKGFAVAIHAIGDAALDATLTALAEGPRVQQRDRVVHAQLIRPDLVARMAKFGEQIVVDVQPRFTVSDFPWVAARVGAHRAGAVCAWRTMMDAGLRLGGGSDAPIEPVSPLLGIHAAVTRRAPYGDGTAYHIEQALTPLEAVRLFGQDACIANDQHTYKGVIAPGWLADLTIVDRDIVMPRHLDDIRDAQIRSTIVGGRIAYDAAGAQLEVG